ncbi:hypothetical protein AAFP30_20615 [Gordonia sp. CPCC 205515]|uniref:hypothetical protein n=1 Tax=Gordonia sp. CPCC 205515 TaxID=3140791 RepID=UPI003AF33C68
MSRNAKFRRSALAATGAAVGAAALVLGAAPADAAITSVRVTPTTPTYSSSDVAIGTSCTYAVTATVTGNGPVTVVAARQIGPNQAVTQFLVANKRATRGTVTAYWTPKVPGTYFVSAYQAQARQSMRQAPPIKKFTVGNGLDVFGNCVVF